MKEQIITWELLSFAACNAVVSVGDPCVAVSIDRREARASLQFVELHVRANVSEGSEQEAEGAGRNITYCWLATSVGWKSQCEIFPLILAR